MKLNFAFSRRTSAPRPELVQTFGQAELLRHADGRWELRGGNQSDRCSAREWVSLFCHEAVFSRDAREVRPVVLPVRHCCRRSAYLRSRSNLLP